MTKKEYIDQLPKKMIDAKKVEKVQSVYGAKFSETVKKIISNSDESIFFDDDYRILSYQEILDAESDLHVNFKDKGIIPIADCGENDFVVYHFIDNSWSKFNINDEVIFKRRATIEELLK